MPQFTTLITLVLEIVRHTPSWVWGVLALLVVLGGRQLRRHTLHRRGVALLPLGLGAYSLWGAAALFGAHANVLLAWCVSAAAVGLLSHRLAWAPGLRHDAASDRFDVPGSVWPMALMLTVFAVRYGVVVSLAFHPGWAADAALSATVSAVYGGLTGLLAGRAAHILAHVQGTRSMVPA
jgi:hypothetical protein